MLLSIRNFIKGPYSLYDEQSGIVTEFNEPVEKKWLPGDVVDKQTGLVLSRNLATHREIVGIVDYMNRTGQGFSVRGIPLYMFHPLNQGYPPMIVSAKVNPKENQLAVVNVEHWDGKWPRAGLTKTLGAVGNIEVEQAAQIQSLKIPSILVDCAELTPKCSKHEILTGLTFHIDPEGCQDVDDVISWRTIGADKEEFTIGIADVGAWIDEESDLNTYAKQLAQTIYKEGVPIMPMLPEAISTNLASLRSDCQQRPILSLVFKIVKGKCVGTRWAKHVTIVDRTYSYESILQDKEVANKLKNFLEIIEGTDSGVGDDPHHWIEVAMILYNTAAATLLKENRLGILRSQPEGQSAEEWQNLSEKTGIRDIAFFGYGAGKYVPSTEENTKHTGLSLDVYCHASSPLRRYADLYNQRCLKYILFGDEKPLIKANCHHLNEQARKAKALDRELWFLKNLQPGKITEVEGILLKKKDEAWTIYIPCWKRKVRAKEEVDLKKEKCLEPSMRVTVRAYTDLRAITNRIVCNFKGGFAPL